MKKVLIPVMILSLLLTGCWDIVESEKLGLVSIMGINISEDNQIKVVINEISEQKQSSNGQQQGTPDKKPLRIHEVIAPTIYGAIEKFNSSDVHRTYFAHTSAIILSEELVESRGISSIIDYFERTPEIRRNTLLLIARKGQFDKIIYNSSNIEAGEDIGKIIKGITENKNSNSYITTNTLGEFLNLLWETGADPYTSGISLIEVNTGNDINTKSVKNILVDSTAVFKKDRLVGWMNNKESRGLLWVKGQVKGGTITVSIDNKELALRIINSSSSIKTVIEDGKIKIIISPKVKSVIGESQVKMDFEERTVSNMVEKLQAEEVKKEILTALDKAKTLNSDMFELGNFIFGKYPKAWENMKNEEVNYFDKISFEINVKSTVNQAGLIRKNLR